MALQATVLVCDDARLEMSGKAFLIGVYLDDIAIPFISFPIQKLCFFLVLEGDLREVPQQAKLEIALPGLSPYQWDLPLNAPPTSLAPGRTRFVYRHPFHINSIPLGPGRIAGRVMFPGGEVKITGPWISVVPLPPSFDRNHPVASG